MYGLVKKKLSIMPTIEWNKKNNQNFKNVFLRRRHKDNQQLYG